MQHGTPNLCRSLQPVWHQAWSQKCFNTRLHRSVLLFSACRGQGLFGPARSYIPSLCHWKWSESSDLGKLASLFSSAGFLAVGVARGHGFHCVSDIPSACKGQAFNGPSVCGLLMVCHAPGKTMASITFLAHFPSDSSKRYLCDVKTLMQQDGTKMAVNWRGIICISEMVAAITLHNAYPNPNWCSRWRKGKQVTCLQC